MNNYVAIFIDNGYLSNMFNDWVKIDFIKFSEVVCDGKERLMTYFYDCKR